MYEKKKRKNIAKALALHHPILYIYFFEVGDAKISEREREREREREEEKRKSVENGEKGNGAGGLICCLR